MKGTRFYKLIIALLVVINLGTLAFIWFGKPPHPPRPGEGPLLSETIGLTDESKMEVDSLEKDHHKKKKLLMHNDRELHQQMFSKIGTDENPSETMFLLNKNKEEIERMTFEFFNDVASYCSEAQLKKLRAFIDNAMINLGPPGHPPRKN